MTGRERILNHLAGQPVDRLPAMPITMMFACERIGARYRDYCTDYRVLVEGQIRTATEFGFDYVNTMSDPAREAADCGARCGILRIINRWRLWKTTRCWRTRPHWPV